MTCDMQHDIPSKAYGCSRRNSFGWIFQIRKSQNVDCRFYIHRSSVLIDLCECDITKLLRAYTLRWRPGWDSTLNIDNSWELMGYLIFDMFVYNAMILLAFLSIVKTLFSSWTLRNCQISVLKSSLLHASLRNYQELLKIFLKM